MRIHRERFWFIVLGVVILLVAGIVLYLNHFYGYFILSEPHFNETYVSLRFDDGLVSQKQAFSLLKKYHLTGTAFVITSKLNSTIEWEKEYYLNWSDLNKIKGFIEIGSHTVNHEDLTRSENYKSEIIDSRKVLIEHGFNVTVFNYPAGNYDKDSLEVVSQNYDCAVTQEVGTNFVPISPYLLKDFTVRSYNTLDTVKRVIKPGKWNILTFHDIGNETQNFSGIYQNVVDTDKVDLGLFESIIKYLVESNYTIITVGKGCEMFKNEK